MAPAPRPPQPQVPPPARTLHPTVEAELTDFQNSLLDRDFARKTVAWYVGGLRKLVALVEETTGTVFDTLTDLLPRDVAQARDILLERGRAGSTANWIVFAGRAWGAHAGKADQFAQIRAVQLGWRPQDALSQTAYERLLRTLDRNAIPKPIHTTHDTALRDYAAFALMLGAGLRKAEAVSVRVRDIRLSPKSGWVRVIGKGLKEREAPIPLNFRRPLQERMDEIYQLNSEDPEAGNLLVLGGIGLSGLDKIVRKWGETAKMPKLSAHMLRRTRGRRWRYVQHVPIENVARYLGHSSIEVTRRYTEDPEIGEQALGDQGGTDDSRLQLGAGGPGNGTGTEED